MAAAHAPEAEPASWVGRRRRRVEDQRLITGAGAYVGDVRLPGMLDLAILRSPHPHARIVSVNLSSARGLRGVIDAFDGSETAHLTHLATNPLVPNTRWPKHLPLAVGKVRYVGDEVAAVLADNAYAARDAVDRIDVEYEPLPAVIGVEAALGPTAPIIHEELGTNEAFTVSYGTPAEEVDAALNAADHVVSLRINHNRLAAVPIETRGIVVNFDKQAQTMQVWTSTQRPFAIRDDLAAVLNLKPEQIRVVAPDVGGAFGSKSILYREYLLAAYLAMKHGRPVRWIGTRSEEMLVANQGRAVISDIDAGFTRDGHLTAIRVKVLGDMGAYLHPHTTLTAPRVGRLSCGAYQVKLAHAEVLGLFTNTTPTGPYRGAGRPEGAYIAERVMDTAARDLGIDPLAVRRRNFISPGQFPWATPMGMTYDSGDYAATLDHALELAGYSALLEQRQEARTRGELFGIGIATFVEPSGGGFEQGRVQVQPDGTVLAATASASHGQGHVTTFAQILADQFQLPIEKITVVENDTSTTPWGIGTYGSRSVILGGSSLFQAGNVLLEKMKKIVGHKMEVDPADVVYARGVFHPAGDPSHALSFAEVAKAAYESEDLPQDLSDGLVAMERFGTGPAAAEAFSHGTHIAAVLIERDTGKVRLLKVVAVDDAGVIVNPRLAEGQLHGGLAQGIAQALFEEVSYDENGSPTAATLMDYAVPKAEQLPTFIAGETQSPSPLNPLGVKGLGEGGTVGIPAAISNAVMDALSEYGVKHMDMPFTAEKIWKVINRQG